MKSDRFRVFAVHSHNIHPCIVVWSRYSCGNGDATRGRGIGGLAASVKNMGGLAQGNFVSRLKQKLIQAVQDSVGPLPE